MGKEATILMLFAVFYLTKFQLASSLNISNTDKSSLLALQEKFYSDVLAKNWSQETSFCTWIGITCSWRHPRVTALDLSGMGLRGNIGREIGNLSFLAFLSIRNNSISGPIPGEIGNLRLLRVLDMAQNQLSDVIPGSIGLLRELKHLNRANNRLSGDIPESVSTCFQLNILDLSHNNLTGDIPHTFGNLSHLQGLNLTGNQLTGKISWRMLNISSMVSFVVGRNHLSGTIPKLICTMLQELGVFSNEFEGEFTWGVISSCHSLQRLSLWGNKFRGAIPPSIANLSSLVLFDIAANSFHERLLPSIANLTNLEVFDITDNGFHGGIPSEIGHLSRLTSLGLGENGLSGEVPPSVFNLSRLQRLGLQMNKYLWGNLPFSIDKGLPNIEQLFLHSNHFGGTIPTSISNLSKLTLLELSKNSFTAHIPITLANLPHLRILNLWRNDFSNNLSMPQQDFLSSFSASNSLQFISIASNPITGHLPKSFGSDNLSASLQQFLANECKITSPLPNEIGNLTKLLLLDLGSNHLSGPFPQVLGNIRSLQALGMYRNKLKGSIPNAICCLPNLYNINFADNLLSGQLPSCLGNLSSLREIILPNNALSFTLPSTLWIDEHVETIILSNNFFYGPLPGTIGNMKDLIQLDLSGNQLSREIPIAITQLQRLNVLWLSNNNLDGPILDSFSNIKDLQILDLSHNHLSGPIPTELVQLVNLQVFNVSFNQLIGEIPDEGPFLNFTPESFAGNKGLCGAPRFKVRPCKRTKPKPSTKNMLLKYILVVISSVAVAAIIIILVMRLRRTKLLPSSLFDSTRVTTHNRISYYAILHATSNLNEENLIGRGSFGSIYKGNFSDAMVAAVKVFNLDVQGALRSFDTECHILRSIRHRNLVKVITACSNLDFKALVMEYMPSGNLEKWLYSGSSSLNIFQRLGIMMDVASAVEYLHEGYTFPIVHCDLKPSNILLDEDMVAHVGDFGISKLLTQEQMMQQTKTLGTIGYIAPEYGSQGIVSAMVNAYSYGILLMEVFTRRKPTDEMFSGDFTMRRWVSESFPNSVLQIVDEELVDMDISQRKRGRRESSFRMYQRYGR